jgi:hypothetical protein
MNDDEQCDRTSTSKTEILIAQVKGAICQNHQLAVQEVAEKGGVSTGLCHIRKRPVMWTAGMRHLHHINAPAHTALSITEYFAKQSIPVLPQYPHHPTYPLQTFLRSLTKNNPYRKISNSGRHHNECSE